MKTIGIVGSRRRNGAPDMKAIEEVLLTNYEDGDRIVSGGCPVGADCFAEYLAKKHQIPILIHYAKWSKYGNRAGFVRNNDIARDADLLIACVAEDRKGGTEDTIQKFLNLFQKSPDKVILV